MLVGGQAVEHKWRKGDCAWGVVQRWSEMIAFRSVLEVSCWGLTDEFIVECEGKKGQG